MGTERSVMVTASRTRSNEADTLRRRQPPPPAAPGITSWRRPDGTIGCHEAGQRQLISEGAGLVQTVLLLESMSESAQALGNHESPWGDMAPALLLSSLVCVSRCFWRTFGIVKRSIDMRKQNAQLDQEKPAACGYARSALWEYSSWNCIFLMET